MCFIPILATFCTVIPPVPIILVHTAGAKVYLLPPLPLLHSSICNPPTVTSSTMGINIYAAMITIPFATSNSMSSTIWHIITYHCIDNFDQSQKGSFQANSLLPCQLFPWVGRLVVIIFPDISSLSVWISVVSCPGTLSLSSLSLYSDLISNLIFTSS